jgi:ankyrin repeat protein
MRVKTKKVAGWLLVPLLSVALFAANATDARLVEAARNRDVAAVRALLKQGVDVNSRYPDGATALHWAAHWSDLETADLLIGAGADVNATDDLGVMPLALACQVGDAAMAQRLLTAGANPNVALHAGETPLMLAARSDSLDAVKALLARGANVNARETTQGQTALMWAAAEKHADVVRALIEVGADVNARSNGHYTPLLFSARSNDVESARVLLAAGAHVNDVDSDGDSPFVVAALMGHTEIARFLLENGADVNSAGGGFTALHWAVGFWDQGFSGPFGVRAENSEWSAISGLRGDAKFEFAKLLLDHGADVNAKLSKIPRRGGLDDSGGTIGLSLVGGTPYLLAANAADARLMRLILDHGGDPHAVLRNGITALMLTVGIARAIGTAYVTESQVLEAAKLAIDMGSDVNSASATGDTAMHAAAYSGFNTVIPFLLEKGANIGAINKSGVTPYLIANGQGPRVAGDNPYRPATAALLRQLGADTTGHCDWPCLSSAGAVEVQPSRCRLVAGEVFCLSSPGAADVDPVK